jgi:HEXXH motif-containing protein
MPIDIGSPHADTMANNEGFVEVGTPETRAFTSSELAGLATSLARTASAICNVNPEVAGFVNTFNRVVILQKDVGAPDLFASGSTAQYIGRTFLANPHLQALDDAQLADALVHEAIHGLLYMEENLEPWVLDPALYSFEPVLVSPWSGNRLAVRPFLQACFVWFGLAHFFAQATVKGAFPEGRAERRLRIASSGFLQQQLEVTLRDYVKRLSPAVVSAINTMQDRITDALRNASE